MAHRHSYHDMASEGASYQIVVRSVFWVIVAAVVLGFAVWWVMT